MKKFTYIFSILLVACTAITFVGCEDAPEPIEELAFDRVFSPLGLQAFVRNNVTIELNWTPSDETDTYVVEFSEEADFSNIVFTEEISEDEIPYRHTLAGETLYFARVKSVSVDDKDDSKWATISIQTLPEDIFETLPLQNVGETTATLSWLPAAEVSHFLITPGNTQVSITADEKEAGEATLEGLTEGVTYSVTLYNGSKKRGTVGFTTLLAANVSTSDDLAAVIAAANEGDVLVLESGTYSIGTVALTKSITIQGQKPYDKPVVYAKMTCGATVNSITFKSIHFRGDDAVTPQSNFFETVTGCNVTALTVEDCEVSNFTDRIFYNGATGTYGTITFKGSFFHDIAGTGGDGIDFRGGTITAFSAENCTFANGIRTVYRMQVTCNTSFRNCTFYKVSNLDNSNNAGIFRANVGGTFEAIKCLFVETGVASPANVSSGNFVRNATNMAATPTYDDNNIFGCMNLLVGLYTTASAIDATELNPNFANAANNNFKVTNQTLIDRVVGDQSWK